MASLARVNDEVCIMLADGGQLIADEILFATGRAPRTTELGLETVGLAPGGWLTVDDTFRVTDVAEGWLYAVGDVDQRALMTHQGKYQARIVGTVIGARADGRPVDDAPWGAHERRRNKGLPHSNRGRFGYYRCEICPKWEFGKKLETWPKCRNGILKVDPVTGPVLAQLYRDYAAGISVTGKPFTSGDLHAIPDSGFGLGYVRYLIPELSHQVVTNDDGSTKRKRVNRQRDVTAFLYYGGAHDAVIDDPSECERIWDAYTKRRMAQSGQSFFSNRPRYSLSRHLRCSGCGGRMQTALRNREYRRSPVDGLPNPLDVTFRCANHIDSKSSANGTYISLAVAETWFLEWLDREAQMSEREAEALTARMAALRTQSDGDQALLGRLENIQGQLEGLRTKDDKLTDAVLAELVSEDSARRKRTELDTQRQALIREQMELRTKLKEVPVQQPRPPRVDLLTARKIYLAASQANRRELVSKLVREIRVNKGRGGPEKLHVYPLCEAPPPWVPREPSPDS